MRVHPLPAWSEIGIGRYVKREGIPFCELYLVRGGRRFRSLGERDITLPVESNADLVDAIIAELEATRTEERAWRAMDQEHADAFERLRGAAYM